MSKVAPSPAAASGDAGGGSPPSSAAAADLRDYLSGRAPGLVFSGWYSDRVYSEQFFGYRDRIRADESEAEAGKVLRGAARKAKKVDGGGIFSGVESELENGCSAPLIEPPTIQSYFCFRIWRHLAPAGRLELTRAAAVRALLVLR